MKPSTGIALITTATAIAGLTYLLGPKAVDTIASRSPTINKPALNGHVEIRTYEITKVIKTEEGFRVVRKWTDDYPNWLQPVFYENNLPGDRTNAPLHLPNLGPDDLFQLKNTSQSRVQIIEDLPTDSIPIMHELIYQSNLTKPEDRLAHYVEIHIPKGNKDTVSW